MAKKVSRSSGGSYGGIGSMNEMNKKIIGSQWNGAGITLPVIRWDEKDNKKDRIPQSIEEMVHLYERDELKASRIPAALYKFGITNDPRLSTRRASALLDKFIEEQGHLIEEYNDAPQIQPKKQAQRTTTFGIGKRVIQKLKFKGVEKKEAQYTQDAYTGNGREMPGNHKDEELENPEIERGKRNRYMSPSQVDDDVWDINEKTETRVDHDSYQGEKAAKREANRISDAMRDIDLDTLRNLRDSIKKSFS